MKALEKELKKIEKAETRMRLRAEKNVESAWKRKLEEKVPDKVIDGLQKAFSKAFDLIFEKGVGMIEKTYDKEALEKEFLVRDYALDLVGGRREIRRLKRDTAGNRAVVTLGSAVEGIGLGALGIGIPDIAIWLGILLRSIYETALSHGYHYESAEEKLFILKMMEASMQRGDAWASANRDVDAYLFQNAQVRNVSVQEAPARDVPGHEPLIRESNAQSVYLVPTEEELKEQIEKTASAFATDMLVMKFIQGVPVVGMIGGATNPFYYQKVMRYVQLKYRKRYLLSKKGGCGE